MSRGAADTFEIVTHSTAPRDFIAMGVPSFGLVNIFWASRAFGQLRHPMNQGLRHFLIVGNEVGLARNDIVARALAIEEKDPSARCSHVFFLDDDVLVHPDALLKLMAHDRDIVSGLYYAKTSVPQPLVLMEQGLSKSWVPGDVVECWAHGMGLTLIKADVFRRLRAETDLGRDAMGNPQWFETVRDSKLLTAAGSTIHSNQTEDVTFLRKAAALGYQPAVDTSPQTFAFHWAQHEQRAYPLKQWFQYQRTGEITWETDAGFVTWGREAA